MFGACSTDGRVLLPYRQALSRFGRKDAAKITKDILVFLPSFANDNDDGRARRRPPRRELLRTLLERAAASLKEDLAPGRNPASLDRSRLYLELSDFVCRRERATATAADPDQLLRFYCTSSLMGKMTLGRLSEDARLFFVVHLARALSACGLRPPSSDSSESGELASMRRQVVDALTIILPVRDSHTLLSNNGFFSNSQSSFLSNQRRRTRKHGSRAKRCCKRVSRLVGRGPCGKTNRCDFFFFYSAFVLFSLSPPSCLSEEGATNELERSATPPRGSGRDCSSGR